MGKSRIAFDPQLAGLFDRLNAVDSQQLHDLAVHLCELGMNETGLSGSLSTVIAKLRVGHEIPSDLRARVKVMADEADDDYLRVLDAEGQSIACLNEFAKARVLMAIVFLFENSSESSLEAIYESYVGSLRQGEVYDIIEAALQ